MHPFLGVVFSEPLSPVVRSAERNANYGKQQKHQLIAQKACRYAALHGNVPYAPHLFFTQFLKDDDKAERRYGQAMGLVWLAQCSELWVIGRRITSGMERKIKKAKEWGIPVKRYVFKRDSEKKLLDALFYPDVEFLEMDV